MFSDAVPQHLTSVLSGNHGVIHIAAADLGLARQPGPQLTLCNLPVADRVSTQGFHRRGCCECARAAVRSGVTSISDRRQSTVNLPRFLASFGDDGGVGAAAVPQQR